MVSRCATAGLIALASLLVACTREVVLDLAVAGGAVTITASRAGGADPLCVQGLVVSLAGADIATTPPLWEVATAKPGRCRTRFVYGQVPPGYSQSGPAPRLLTGSRYLFEVSGPGLQGGKEFTLQGDAGSTRTITPR